MPKKVTRGFELLLSPHQIKGVIDRGVLVSDGHSVRRGEVDFHHVCRTTSREPGPAPAFHLSVLASMPLFGTTPDSGTGFGGGKPLTAFLPWRRRL